MSRSRQAIGLMFLLAFGLWGCSRYPSDGGTVAVDKLKAVESKLTRLEDDLRTAATARDQLAKRLQQADEARAALQSKVEQMANDVKAKDEVILKRVAERDQVTNQYKAFRDSVRELLTKFESESGSAGGVPVIPTGNTKPNEAPIIPIPAPAK